MGSSGDDLHPHRLTGVRLWRASYAWGRAVTKALAPLGLTQVQFLLLSGLVELSRDGAIVTQSRAARHAGVNEMMASQVLRTLEARGLVERRIDPRDCRARSLALTPEGAEMVPRAAALLVECDRVFFLDPPPEVVALTAGRRDLVIGG